MSHIRVPAAGGSALEEAFHERLREVEAWPGFCHLEVWRDEQDDQRYVMVSWWADETSFRAYLRSDPHARSHARISDGPDRPRPAGLERFRLVAR